MIRVLALFPSHETSYHVTLVQLVRPQRLIGSQDTHRAGHLDIGYEPIDYALTGRFLLSVTSVSILSAGICYTDTTA